MIDTDLDWSMVRPTAIGAEFDLNNPQSYEHAEILTYSGGRVNPLDLKPEDVNPIDIAHALSNSCRYTGHPDKFYSVAEHSVIMYDYFAKDLASQYSEKEADSILSWLIHHDDDEAYLLDLAAPLKHHISGFGTVFKETAAKIMDAVVERFDLSLPEPAIVKQIDIGLRETELDVLFPRATDRNHYGDGLGLPVRIHGWTPPEAKMQFIWRLQNHGFVERDRNGRYIPVEMEGT